MRRYSFFNLLSLAALFFSLGGNFWLWKGKITNLSRTHETPPVVAVTTREEVEAKTQASQKRQQPKVTSTIPIQLSVVSSTPETQTASLTSTSAPTEIPRQINLAVPFTSQAPEKNWSQPWQDACEEAAVLMLDAYYKKYKLNILFSKDEILKMVQWEEDVKEWGRSIEIEKIQELVHHYMKISNSKIIENPNIEQIKQYVAAGAPVYVVADGKVLPNPHFRNGGPEYHVLIIRGYTETEFITNDPGTQFGENFSYKYSDLMNSIRDWNGGEVKTGKRAILVLE